LAGRPLAGAGLENLTHDHFLDIAGGDTGPLDRRLYGDLAKFMSRQ
jgi:hypothetical protein